MEIKVVNNFVPKFEVCPVCKKSYLIIFFDECKTCSQCLDLNKEE